MQNAMLDDHFPPLKDAKLVIRALTPVHSNVLLRVDVPTSKDGRNKSERARKSGQRGHRGRTRW